jgi:hypothetical protein
MAVPELTRRAAGLPPLGGADGEALRDGLLAQPVNAISSFGLAAAGVAIFLAARARRGSQLDAGVFAAALTAAGLGSVDYHGTQTRAAHWSHDVGLVAALAFVATYDAGRTLGWSTTERHVALAAIVGASGLTAAVVPGSGALLGLAAGGAAAAGEVSTVVKDGLPRGREAKLLGGAAAALGLGATAYVLGRSGGVAAHPRSPVPGHAVWHVLTAVSLAAWGAARLVPAKRRLRVVPDPVELDDDLARRNA